MKDEDDQTARMPVVSWQHDRWSDTGNKFKGGKYVQIALYQNQDTGEGILQPLKG